MSIKAMSAVWEGSPAKRSELLVLLALADFSDQNGHCWPCVNTLCQRARISRRATQMALRELEETQQIVVIAQPSMNRSTVTYRICIENMGEWGGAQNMRGGANPTSRGGEVQCAGGAKQGSPDPLLNHQGTLIPPISPKGDVLRGFDKFWSRYPRKIGKGAAEKAWGKIKVDEPLFHRIIHAIKAQEKSAAWMKDGGQFIPHPATWLNQKRWDDEVIQGNGHTEPEDPRVAAALAQVFGT